ncbi:RrF2 family transcriptional regulator [Serpentinicella alkaliphila]|uniref:BadM/Rrf2 family transcriptional regulator n=2 Tax=Serpentinicella alkaliphila TaxID=1734049 RepID=A0A4R2TMY9_9FIRM|nr:Rrf2 family transcriptional regulator [Serpentinicella alkaliphila]TCQ04166.1 BadM/Rrf2 family transcriptional regulator [Serpentinicella alkaliphila]
MSGIINLSEMVTLGLHSMVLIANKEKPLLSVKEIAFSTNSSEFHLSKVLQILVKKGFIKSVRGPKGGFTLAMEPENISFYDIYTALEGPVNIKKCPISCNNCAFQSCIFANVLEKLNDELIQFLQTQKLNEFLR